MRISHGLIALGIALVAGCGTTAGVQSLGSRGPMYRTMAISSKAQTNLSNPTQNTGAKQNVGQRPTGQQAGARQNVGQTPTGQQPGARQNVGQTPTGQQAGAKQNVGQMPTGQQPGATSQPPAKTPAGGGGGPIDVKSPTVSKAMGALNLHVINQAQAQSQLTTVNTNNLELKTARAVSQGVVTGIAPQALSILRANLGRARFLSRDGLLIPYVIQGTDYVPLIVTVAGRPEAVFFTEDCATSRFVAHTIVV